MLANNNIINLDIKEVFKKRSANDRLAHHLAKHEVIGDGIFNILVYHDNSSGHGACSAAETVKAIAGAG